jgi:hypothetical protein
VKIFRLMAFFLALGAFPLFLVPAQAQQEIDPDHYDQTASPQAGAHREKARSGHKMSSAHHQANGDTRVASKHSVKAGHHRSHVSA